jgi:hypothetical protein
MVVGEAKLLTTSSNLCEGGLSYFSPEELLGVLHHSSIGRNGHGILFTGDSMTRQLMLRVVSYLRREAHFSEHYFHEDGLYVMYENEDALMVLDAEGKADMYDELREYFPGYLAAADEIVLSAKRNTKEKTHVLKRGRLLLAMMFQWETKPSVYRKEFLRMQQIPLHIAAFMYWWQNKDPVSDIDDYMKAVESKLADEAPAFQKMALHKEYIFLTTPWTDPGLFGGVEARRRIERNAKVSSWIASKQSVDSSSGTRWGLLDYSSIAEAEHLPKTKDGIHYMCIWTPKYPLPVKMQKYNYQNCTDPMGLAVLQWLAHSLASGLTHPQRGG